MSADADSGAAPSSSDGIRQEIRLAVVMTGGVSLAIWMGGVARELNLLLHRGAGASELAHRVQDCYRSLRDILNVGVSVDVLSGTSAGGINAAILGLANVHDADIGPLRELWLTDGAFSRLLRDPGQHPTPSLLQGDGQLLAGLRTALAQIVPPGSATAASPPPTDVFITTTFLDGEPSRFVDDYGTLVSDVDHHGLFHFDTGQLAADGAAGRLALAGRCTASFPVAFEPAHLTIGAASADPAHPDMTGLSNASRTCYVADGGLLANRPIAAAVRAVFDRPADTDVRRILLYVVPTAAPTVIPVEDTMPLLGTALLRDLSAMTSQAITADLAGIRAHNESVRVRIDAYRQLAALADRAAGHLVDQAMYRQYRLRVCDSQADQLVEEALRQLDPPAIPLEDDGTGTAGTDGTGTAGTDGTGTAGTDGTGTAGERAGALLANVAAALAAAMPDGVPGAGDWDAVGRLGRRGYDAAKTMALDLINRAFLARPDRDQRRSLAQARARVHEALAPPTAASMDLAGIVAGALRGRPLSASLVTRWAASQQTAEDLAGGWRRLAAAVAEAAPTLQAVLTPDDAMLRCLGRDPDTIAARLAELHIAHGALLPQTQLADQPLELIEVSADTATNLDPRNQATQKLTGLQLHHFGAFYKYSWRASDWMWGRLDGAGWIVHALLDPVRLRTLRRLDDDPAGYGGRLIARLGAIASATADGGPAGDADSPAPPAVRSELDALWREDCPPPASLPETAKWVAAGIQRIILAEELPCVAEQIGVDERAGATVNPAARAFLAAMDDPSADVQSRLHACQVSSETFAGEKDSKLFADTFKETLVVAIAAVQDSGKIPALVKPGLGVTKFEVELIPGRLLVRSAEFLRRL